MSNIKIKVRLTENKNRGDAMKFAKQFSEDLLNNIYMLMLDLLLQSVIDHTNINKFEYKQINKGLYIIKENNSTMYFYVIFKKNNLKFVSPDKKVYFHLNKRYLMDNIYITNKKAYLNSGLEKQFLYDFFIFYDKLETHLVPDKIHNGKKNKIFSIGIFISDIINDLNKKYGGKISISNIKLITLKSNIAKIIFNLLNFKISVIIAKTYDKNRVEIIDILEYNLCKRNVLSFKDNRMKVLLEFINYLNEFNELIKKRKFHEIKE